MSRASGLRAKLGVSVEVFSLPADGDCFYTGVSRALSSVRGGGGGGAEGGAAAAAAAPSIKQLRLLVASQCTAATFEEMRGLACAGVDGFQWLAPGRRIDPVEGVEAMRARLAETSAEAGKSRVVWADHFAIVKCLDHTGLAVLLVDDNTPRDPCSVVWPDWMPRGAQQQQQQQQQRFCGFVMMHRTRRQHFNLLGVSGRLVFETARDLPAVLRARFGLALCDGGGDGGGDGDGAGSGAGGGARGGAGDEHGGAASGGNGGAGGCGSGIGQPSSSTGIAAAGAGETAERHAATAAAEAPGAAQPPGARRARVTWSPSATSPPPSRERLHKRARVLSDETLDDGAGQAPSKRTRAQSGLGSVDDGS